MKHSKEFEEIFIRVLTPLISRSVNKALNGIKLPESEQKKDKLLSVREAADFLGLAVPTVYSMTSNNKIPFRKPGKKLYFLESELIKWIDSSKRKSKPELDQEAERYITKKGGSYV